MAFVEPITVKEAVENIHQKKYLLPAIQREFVWETDQIEKLFDSLMQDYPINSFLFWDVEQGNIQKYQFYEFIRDYHERDNRHNPKASLNGEKGITAILDGQQRLTSLYIGLKGSYSSKLPYKRWDNDSAYPKRRLYLNLLASDEEEGYNSGFNFRFLPYAEPIKRHDNSFWFLVGEILNLEEEYLVNDFLMKHELFSIEKEQFIFANRTLFKLHSVVHKNKSINMFLEKGESLDKVLNIFIRVNSGGTQLNYSDLLLSIATAQWKEKDAREEINSFVDEINAVGSGFQTNKDFVLKNCLVLCGFRDIAFKVDNFNQSNMHFIEKNWERITKAIKMAFILVSSFGYNRDTLTSYYALIPIALYLFKLNSPDNFIESSKFQEDRKKIFKWLAVVLLKRTFGGNPDSVLRPMREVIEISESDFPIDGIINKLRGTAKSITFSEDDIENLLHYQYGQPYVFSVLAFLYPSLDFRNKFHKDHIFPKKLFKRLTLLRRGIPEKDLEFYLDNYDSIANLQLLEGLPNQEKSDQEFEAWLNENYSNTLERQSFVKRHYIPDVALPLENFKEFIEERQKLLSSAFRKVLL